MGILSFSNKTMYSLCLHLYTMMNNLFLDRTCEYAITTKESNENDIHVHLPWTVDRDNKCQPLMGWHRFK